MTEEKLYERLWQAEDDWKKCLELVSQLRPLFRRGEYSRNLMRVELGALPEVKGRIDRLRGEVLRRLSELVRLANG